MKILAFVAVLLWTGCGDDDLQPVVGTVGEEENTVCQCTGGMVCPDWTIPVSMCIPRSRAQELLECLSYATGAQSNGEQ